MKFYEGKLIAKDAKIAIICPRFNDFIVSKLLEGSHDALIRHDVDEENIHVFKCPGAFEIPVIADRLASSSSYDAVICLGAVIRGATSHYDYVCSEVSKGIANVALKYSLPVIFGVLTTDNIEQAIERAGSKSGNKGFEAATSAIEMINLFANIK